MIDPEEIHLYDGVMVVICSMAGDYNGCGLSGPPGDSTQEAAEKWNNRQAISGNSMLR
jgi:hypothetical protein